MQLRQLRQQGSRHSSPRALHPLRRDAYSLVLLWALVLFHSAPVGAQPTGVTLESGGAAALAISTEMVSLTVSVTDAVGRQVPGLSRGHFRVFENDVAQEITHFAAQDRPTSVGVVFDLSASMEGEKLRAATRVLARFIHTTHPEDDYTLVSFNDQAQVLMEAMRDGDAMLARVGSFLPRGSTALYDAVAVGLKQVQRGRWPKRALVIVTDGDDNRLRLSEKELKRLAEESGVVIYAVLLRDHSSRPVFSLPIEAVCKATGGKSYFPDDAEETSEAFEQVALELRHLYSLGYVPRDFKPDGKWRRLKVMVTPPDGARVVVRHRKGYYALAERTRQKAKLPGADVE